MNRAKLGWSCIIIGCITIMGCVLGGNVAFAQQIDRFAKNYIIDYTIDAEISTGDAGRLNYLSGEFFFQPRSSERQHLLDIIPYSSPKADSINISRVYFEWHELYERYRFGYDATIRTDGYIFPVKHEPFPVKIDKEVFMPYLEFDDFIENTEIIDLLSIALTEGDRDAFMAVGEIGNWIYEHFKVVDIEDENRLVSPTDLIKLKSGNPVEISLLFISLVRSLEIPARYVAGMVDRNGKMQSHAWIEVYFTNSGWIPFDAVLGQFGCLDQTHLVLCRHSSVPQIMRHEWKFYPYFGDIEVPVSKKPIMRAKLRNPEPAKMNPLDLSLNVMANEVSTSGFIPVVLSIYNKNPYYVSDLIELDLDDQIDVNRNKRKIVNLAPYEEKQINYMVNLVEDEGRRYSYQSLLKVKDQYGVSDSIWISFEPNGRRIDRSLAKSMLDTISIFQGFNSPDIYFSAKVNKKYYQRGEKPEITFFVSNDSSKVKDLSIISSVKKSFDAEIPQEEEFKVEFDERERFVFSCIKDADKMVCRPVIFNRFNDPEVFFKLKAARLGTPEDSHIDFFIVGDVTRIHLECKGKSLLDIEVKEKTFIHEIPWPWKSIRKSKYRLEMVYFDSSGNEYRKWFNKRFIFKEE
ncbi:transglutaminase domain-containing protein [Puteibacter caeruleilacunae]|nr:transglutaminase domain-containing protein [Puteibacter caeruleilacunae]